VVSGGLAVAVVAAVWAAAPWLAREMGYPAMAGSLRTAAAAIPFLVAAAILVAPARGLKLMGPTVLAIQVTQPAVALVATIALVRAGAALEGAAWGFVLSAGLAAAVALILLARLRLPPAAPGRPPVGSLLRFSLPVAGMTMTGTALLWIDTLLLGVYRPPGDVATYGVVVRLLAIAAAVLLTVIQVFGPFVTQLVARGDRDRLAAVLQTATRWVVLAAAPVLVLLVVVGGPLLRVFRQPSARGWAAMSILAGAFLVDAFTGPVGHVLTMSGRSWLNLLNNAVSLVCNVALNLVLIPRFGLIGAAVSWAVVIAGTNVARLIQVRRIFGIGPFSRSLVKPVVALAAGALGGVAARIALSGLVASRPAAGIAAVAAVFGVTYVVSLGALGLEDDDRTLVGVVLGRAVRRAA
jgi:O-antigen/teichoic acid export membrane protein